jgi:hypothetical protein
MNPADMFEVFKRLGERKTPLLDERAHVPALLEQPLFLQKEENAPGGFES